MLKTHLQQFKKEYDETQEQSAGQDNINAVCEFGASPEHHLPLQQVAQISQTWDNLWLSPPENRLSGLLDYWWLD